MEHDHLLIATGVEREARLVRRAGVVAIPGGGDAGRLARALEDRAAGACGILSFGFCGALDPALRIGEWIVGTQVLGGCERATDANWRTVLAARLPDARAGSVYADGRMISRAKDKQALFRATGALAADMESHVAAGIARAHGLPFAILRLVSDEAGQDLPPVIQVAMAAGGGLHWGAMLRSLLRRPAQLPALARTLTSFARADRVLRTDVERATPWCR